MAAGTFNFYNVFKQQLGTNGGGLSSATFSIALMSAGYTPNVATDLSATAISTYKISGVSGYAAKVLSAVEWSAVSGNKYKFDAADVSFTASALMQAKYAVIYRQADNVPVCYCDLATTSATGVEATQINISFHANGIGEIG